MKANKSNKNSHNLYVKRGSLDKIIASREMISSGENKLFDNEEIFKWSFDILSALTYLRTKCIVHRDVKPQFVFFLKLLFFSIKK